MWRSPWRGGADHRSRWQCLVMSVTADEPQVGTTANTTKPLQSKHARTSVVLVQRRLKWAALDLLQRHEGRSTNRKTQSNEDSSTAYRNPAWPLQLVKNNKIKRAAQRHRKTDRIHHQHWIHWICASTYSWFLSRATDSDGFVLMIWWYQRHMTPAHKPSLICSYASCYLIYKYKA